MTRWFEAPLTTLAFCWRVARCDGVTIGLTSHDRDLQWGGVVYQAAPGLVPSAIERGAGLEPDTMQLSGALSSNVITEQDLLSGLWDGARLTLWAVDWTKPGDDPVPLARGRLGSVEMRDGQFSVELEGPARAFDDPVTEAITPHCRARLGDPRCRVDMAGRVSLARVLSLEGNVVVLDRTPDTGAFVFGSLLWTEGPIAGARHIVLSQEADRLTLDAWPRFIPGLPCRVELTQGCDRRFSTCRDRFQNTLNFRGEPHLPGNDLLTRYGG